MPIGVFDSGLGGLTVLKSLRKTLPGNDFVYFGDNTNAPIGGRSADQIIDITIKGTQTLFDQGCDLVILACNTASAVALRQMQEYFVPANRRVLGVFVPVIEALAGRNWADPRPPLNGPMRNVALFATKATVESRAFDRELNLRLNGTTVLSRACPGLVDALETGDRNLAAKIVRNAVADILALDPAPAAAILGCTHYPLVADIFRTALPDKTRILSQPDLVAASLCDYLARYPRFSGGTGQVSFFTSGDPVQVSAEAISLTGVHTKFAAV